MYGVYKKVKSKRNDAKEEEGNIRLFDSYALRILKPLKDGKATYSKLMKNSGLVRSNFNTRLNELLKLELGKG